jgi:hypothetical protein
LVQPRFFCGQLLTDQDLKALVHWTQDKLRLGRFRRGWGVVCGLDARCDSQHPSQIIISPGYALSCCGDDIVVCQDTSLDLSGVCKEPQDPCATLRPPVEAKKDPETVILGGMSIPASELRVADIYISYREEGSDAIAALSRAVCVGVSSCEYTRTHETSSLNWQHGVIGSDPVLTAAKNWEAQYGESFKVIEDFSSKGFDFTNEAAQSESRADSVRQWLLRWLGDHPLHEFCWVRDWISDKRTNLAKEREAVKALFWIVQDCRNTFLRCGPYECNSSQGVPLARAWLRKTKDAKGKPQCDVVSIDAYPPYRRLLRPECWVAPLGHVNLGRAVWYRVEEAAAILQELGVYVAGEDTFKLPERISELKHELSRNLFAPVGGSRMLLVFDAAHLGKRVVGFAEPPRG